MAADEKMFQYGVVSLLLMGPPTFIFLQFLSAPYGKHSRPGWGPTLYPPIAWFFMESPTLWLTLLLFPLGRHRISPPSLALIFPFLLHYLHRTCLYPLRLHLKTRFQNRSSLPAPGFPLALALMGFAFNSLNSYLQARCISHYCDYQRDPWFWWRFWIGSAVFGIGIALNVLSDSALLRLKSEGSGYKIPRGGPFELVSCPNYLGEIVEWLGWAFMCWSWAGLAFFLYTFSNLVPRARQTHNWYLLKFGEDYPKKRKAVVPFLY